VPSPALHAVMETLLRSRARRNACPEDPGFLSADECKSVMIAERARAALALNVGRGLQTAGH
jgi:hypothetical protein